MTVTIAEHSVSELPARYREMVDGGADFINYYPTKFRARKAIVVAAIRPGHKGTRPIHGLSPPRRMARITCQLSVAAICAIVLLLRFSSLPGWLSTTPIRPTSPFRVASVTQTGKGSTSGLIRASRSAVMDCQSGICLPSCVARMVNPQTFTRGTEQVRETPNFHTAPFKGRRRNQSEAG